MPVTTALSILNLVGSEGDQMFGFTVSFMFSQRDRVVLNN